MLVLYQDADDHIPLLGHTSEAQHWAMSVPTHRAKPLMDPQCHNALTRSKPGHLQAIMLAHIGH